MDEISNTNLKNIVKSLEAKRVEDGDYCRYHQEIITIQEGTINICDKCHIRCIHSGSKLEQDHLIKKKNESNG